MKARIRRLSEGFRYNEILSHDKPIGSEKDPISQSRMAYKYKYNWGFSRQKDGLGFGLPPDGTGIYPLTLSNKITEVSLKIKW